MGICAIVDLKYLNTFGQDKNIAVWINRKSIQHPFGTEAASGIRQEGTPYYGANVQQRRLANNTEYPKSVQTNQVH